MADLLRASTLLLMLLNPFLVILYLLDPVAKLSLRRFAVVMVQASLISMAVFILFALLGDAIFGSVIQAEFASFQMFGGIIFLLIGIQFVFQGTNAIDILRGESPQLAGAVAMPIMVGPGTISASVLIGERLAPLPATVAVVLAISVSAVVMIFLKGLHDYVRPKRERLVERYTEVAGRILALYVGTISVDMIMQGVRSWADMF